MRRTAPPHPGFRRRIRHQVFFWLLAATTTFAWASEDYLVRSWDFETGLSTRGLNALCLGQDGFLWLGAKDGLLRFDGIQFVHQSLPYSSLLQGNNITAVWEDGLGRLWLGCETGNVVCWDRSRAEIIAQPLRWAAQAVRAIAGDRHGDVWIALASHDLIRVRDGWTLHAPATAPARGSVQPFFRTNDGRLFEQLGDSIRTHAGTREQPVWNPVSLPETTVARVAPARAGGLWVYANGHIRRWTGTAWGEDRGELPSGTFITRMVEAGSGDLFVGTLNQGLLILNADGTTQKPTGRVDLANEWIVDLAEDREGNIIACTAGSLNRIRTRRAMTIPSIDNWGGSRLVSVAAAPNGDLWVGTEGSGLYRVGPDKTEHFDGAAGLSKPFVWSLLAEADDRLWVGTWGAGLFFGNKGQFSPAAYWDLPQGWIVSVLLRDRTGILWAGTNTGLWRFVANVWAPVYGPDGGPIMPVRGLVEDAAGRIWMATNGSGVGVFEHGKVRMFDAQDGISARFISGLYHGSDGNLWAGTLGAGLYCRHDGRWSQIDHRNGLPADDVFHIAEDGRGHHWFTSNAGVFAVTTQELLACTSDSRTQIHPLIIDHDDGLPSNYCSGGTQSAAYMGPDGRYIVPTDRGLAVIPTNTITRQTHKVTVAITSASIDDRLLEIHARQVIRAPAGTRRVTIDFTAPSLTNPERIRFRYQLHGLDPKWVDLGTRRNVLFSHLPPGSYTLSIAASNPDGIWNPTAAVLTLVIEPYFWEAMWFGLGAVCLLLAMVAGAVWYLVQRRARWQVEQLEHQQAVERERRRIARDIHDDLGASLTRIMMMSQPPLSSSQGMTPGPTVLNQIHTVACDITRSMDELIWTINPSHDTLESFAAYSVRITQEIVTSAGLRSRLNIPELFPETRLGAGIRHHLLLILKEALTNAVRHAGASEITLTIAVDQTRLVLEVSDNGKGFAPPDPVPSSGRPRMGGGQGLPNLRRRAEEMGGRLDILSLPGRGTTVRLTIDHFPSPPTTSHPS